MIPSDDMIDIYEVYFNLLVDCITPSSFQSYTECSAIISGRIKLGRLLLCGCSIPIIHSIFLILSSKERLSSAQETTVLFC